MMRYFSPLFCFIVFILAATILPLKLSAQPDYSSIRFEDYIYVDYIKSIQFNDGSSQFGDPITSVNGRLYLSFDDLSPDLYNYNYQIIHCDRDWNPSAIEPSEYVDAFNYDEIPVEGTLSKFTKVDYVHYTLDLPTRQVSWTISGNYLLLIYDQEDNPVLSRRFIIYESVGKLRTTRVQSINAGGHNTHHRVGIEYWDLPTAFADRMYLAGIGIKVMQNNNWSTLSEEVKPSVYQAKEFVFNSSKFPSFDAYRDYRQLDIRALEFNGSNLLEVREELDSVFALMPLNKPFTRESFSSEFDRNGRYIINRRDGNTLGTTLESVPADDRAAADYNQTDRIYGDYAWVVLAMEAQDLPDAPVYMIGEFSDYKLYPEYQLHYDESRSTYIGMPLMKQGRYDYHIVQVIDGEISYLHTERHDQESTQDYRTIVYYREFGGIYDRVLNTAFLNVNKDL